MDDNDPITQFFPGEDDVDLYAVLSLQKDASLESIRKSYRKLALVYHPDKQLRSSDDAKADASKKFQQVGFAYSVLSDSKRKSRYDSTGRTDEGFEDVAENGWEAYFEDLFDRVTRDKLDDMKKSYQGSPDEIQDLKEAFVTTKGDMTEIMTHIPHSTHDDEPRFITIITDLIKKGELESTPLWTATSKDEKAKLVRKKQAETEAKEAEDLAKELGVWDEFYGGGKATKRKSRKGKGKEGDAEGDEDHSVLQAMIQKKKQNNMDSFFDGLAAKYADPASKKGRSNKRDHDGEKAGSDVPPPPDLDDSEFAKIQERLFGGKSSSERVPRKKARKSK